MTTLLEPPGVVFRPLSPPPRCHRTHSTSHRPHCLDVANELPLVVQTAPHISALAASLSQYDTESYLDATYMIEESAAGEDLADTESITDTEDSQTEGNFYVIRVGRRPGVYSMRMKAMQQIVNFPGAMVKTYYTKPCGANNAAIYNIIHVDTIYRAAHLIPVYGRSLIVFFLLCDLNGLNQLRENSSAKKPLKVKKGILGFADVALPISHFLEIPLDPISLTEALPFFVCTKPLRLAAAVFNHAHLLSPVKEGRWRGQMKPAGEVVMEAIENSGNAILRDYALEIAVLSMGAKSKVGGLKEFCALAALTLTLDCILFGTFYATMLAIMVERSSNNLTTERKPSALVRSPPQVQDNSLSRQLLETLLGVKGSMLRQKNSPPPEVKEENPLARLKLLLIVSFLTLHILNFATTLTPATISRYQTQTLIDSAVSEYSVVHKVDITSPAIASVLANLAAIDVTFQVEDEANVSAPADLLVKIAPPLYIRVTPPGPVRPRALFTPPTHSATAKRDPVGKNPKRRLWAEAGLSILNAAREDIELPLWTSLADREELIQRTVRLTADLLCELVARSEFDAAEIHLNALLSLTHAHDLFNSYSARITLHAAHLAHALGDTERAGVCYRVAKSVDDKTNAGTGSHLKFALSLSTLVGENHLRALLLAQVGAQYSHTAPAHAMETLAVCETLGAGMGAKLKEADGGKGKGKGKEKEKISDGNAAKHDSIGNDLLRLWVGERFLDIFKRANKPHRVAKQEAFNVMYRGAVDGMVGRARWPSIVEFDQDGADEEDVRMQNTDQDQDVEM
ncbi:hypothetical protein DEU56DRAFT_761555 [Suillus clintonianus]|uniref:uncharacterized protein n=1 Tax=Suillus clintonianus TaxID=1904413 RepID=UPI001B87775F|nr:uncharacterized protein DEU56DRAFT_761555 [Suillus clintonianus]KAG2116280.1 hypothetical protein DEU56DRAFT_761555 [Suillus clintonianus]